MKKKKQKKTILNQQIGLIDYKTDFSWQTINL